MYGFKRFCTIIFIILNALLIAALLQPWTMQPSSEYSANLIGEHGFYYNILLGVSAVVLIGLLILFIVAISGRKPHDAKVYTESGDSIIVSKSAVQSQARCIIDSTKKYDVAKVIVKNAHHKKINIIVKIRPIYAIDVRSDADSLQSQLKSGMEKLLGSALGTITLHILEPIKQDSADFSESFETSAPNQEVSVNPESLSSESEE